MMRHVVGARAARWASRASVLAAIGQGASKVIESTMAASSSRTICGVPS